MISIIICSRTNDISATLRGNIVATIGCKHEIVVIDNSCNQYNIFQAYNEGVARSKGDILCFMHDDIIFLNEGWGALVERMMVSDDKIGAIGVAGGHLMYNCPCSWWNSEITSMHVFTLASNGQYDESIHREHAATDATAEVASIDGLWMCIRKNLFDTIRFDDKTFSGFHCYDSDICMQILLANYKIKVTFAIDILHKGKGNLNEQYYHDLILWHEKWKDYLPIYRGISLTENELKIHQQYALKMYERQKELLSLYNRLHGPEYRLGHFLLKPFRFIIRNSKKNNN